MSGPAEQWRRRFVEVVQRPETATAFGHAAQTADMTSWTKALTAATVEVCGLLGWKATAKGHRLDLLPVARSEYLALDVVAFADGSKRWRFPTAVCELENNSDDDRIAYSLWKVLCVRADLRIVFCYRRNPEDGSRLVQKLRDEVVHAMDLGTRTSLIGETVVVVGSRGEAQTFPYGFFKWWTLEQNTASFRLM